MLLHSVKISGFRSFRKPAEIFISPRTTVLIGPNDHGKTNVLLAINKLSAKEDLSKKDVNDRVPDGTTELSFRFTVTDADVMAISAALEPLIEADLRAANADVESIPAEMAAAVGDARPTERKAGAQILHTPLEQWWVRARHLRQIELVRSVTNALEVREDGLTETDRERLLQLLRPQMPKVVLFTLDSLRQLPDTVNLAALDDHEVMQGVFRLAGIWEERERLLAGNTRPNEDDLREASKTLTEQIRKNWTQGKDLEFYLGYVGNDIRLTVKDTTKTVTAVGDRSDGFTAYFAMRMLLVARTAQASPNGYLFMFDEPGLNLHPKGQVDLQNVFEDIARTNQIVYSTHSVFLINKNYPDRNHLIFKNEQGSNVDNKPFVGGWAKVKEHLGLYLSANFLFTDKILLAEGCTDEIYLPLILQGLIERGKFTGDMNSFAIRSSLNSKEMLPLANMYLQEQRTVTVLVDGDNEGRQRKLKIEAWAKTANKDCPVIILSEYKGAPCSIEDLLEPAIYLEAVTTACTQAVEAGHVKPSRENWLEELRRLMRTVDGRCGEERVSLGKRVEVATKEVFGESISDNAIAFKYAELLQSPRETGPRDQLDQYWNDEALQRLANDLWKSLKLSARGDTTGIPFAT